MKSMCLTIFPILLIFQLFWWSLFWLPYCFINYSIFLIANPFFREKTSLLKYQSGQADVQKRWTSGAQNTPFPETTVFRLHSNGMTLRFRRSSATH